MLSSYHCIKLLIKHVEEIFFLQKNIKIKHIH